jgi:hypothetical protein
MIAPLTALDGALRLWFVLTALSVGILGTDVARTPAIATVMKWGWVLVVAYTGPVGLVIYLLSCREPLPGQHAAYVAPLWKQAVGSTIHCVAGDATGIIAGALVGAAFAMAPRVDAAFEYGAGFAFGLLIFQALFMRRAMGGSYATAVRRTVLPEWLSMNALMAGMFPVMGILMAHVLAAADPRGLRFWGVMSSAILVGAFTAFPVNVWLVSNGLKHGMGTAQVLGHGGSDAMHADRRRPGAVAIGVVAALTLIALAIGLAISMRWGNL